VLAYYFKSFFSHFLFSIVLEGISNGTFEGLLYFGIVPLYTQKFPPPGKKLPAKNRGLMVEELKYGLQRGGKYRRLVISGW